MHCMWKKETSWEWEGADKHSVTLVSFTILPSLDPHCLFYLLAPGVHVTWQMRTAGHPYLKKLPTQFLLPSVCIKATFSQISLISWTPTAKWRLAFLLSIINSLFLEGIQKPTLLRWASGNIHPETALQTNMAFNDCPVIFTENCRASTSVTEIGYYVVCSWQENDQRFETASQQHYWKHRKVRSFPVGLSEHNWPPEPRLLQLMQGLSCSLGYLNQKVQFILTCDIKQKRKKKTRLCGG